VVISGGGNFDAYYMGAYMVLARAAARSGDFAVRRFAGASAGGMMPFEIALKGEQATLLTHHAYALLEETWSITYSTVAVAASLQDHHWRLMADWQCSRWNTTLSSLNDVIFLATSCLDPFPKLVKISRFTSPAQAASAFMSTGTVAEWYDGMLCSDGGSMSGPNMTPLFQDGVRPMVIINLMQCGERQRFPLSMAMGKYNTTQFIELCQKGQDEAAAFLRAGSVRANAISFCPLGAKVSGNVCTSLQPSPPSPLLSPGAPLVPTLGSYTKPETEATLTGPIVVGVVAAAAALVGAKKHARKKKATPLSKSLPEMSQAHSGQIPHMTGIAPHKSKNSAARWSSHTLLNDDSTIGGPSLVVH